MPSIVLTGGGGRRSLPFPRRGSNRARQSPRDSLPKIATGSLWPQYPQRMGLTLVPVDHRRGPPQRGSRQGGSLSRRTPGEGSIPDALDGRWHGRMVLQDGSRKHFYGKTQQEVRRALSLGIRARDAGHALPGERLVVSGFLEPWLTHTRPAVRSSTWKRVSGTDDAPRTPLPRAFKKAKAALAWYSRLLSLTRGQCWRDRAVESQRRSRGPTDYKAGLRAHFLRARRYQLPPSPSTRPDC